MHHQRVTELYQHHADAIRRFIYRRTGDMALSEDLCNDVFVRVIEGLPSYTERGLPIEAWLYRITRDRIIDYYRKQTHRQAQSLNDEHAVVSDAATIESDDMFQQMLAHLNPEQQQVLLLRYRDDLTFAQIAQAMHRSEGAVKQLRLRGLQQLKEHYRPIRSA